MDSREVYEASYNYQLNLQKAITGPAVTIEFNKLDSKKELTDVGCSLLSNSCPSWINKNLDSQNIKGYWIFTISDVVLNLSGFALNGNSMKNLT